MARNENPPFGRGETFYNGATIVSADLGGLNLEGMIWVFEDLQYNSVGQVGAKPARTNREVHCMCVRNVGTVNILPKQCVNLQTAGTDGRFYEGRVDGKSFVTAQRTYPADEWLPAAGVPPNDLFWIVIEGPATVQTPLDGGADNVFNVGTVVVALTGATSGATTAGRVAPQDLTGATSLLGNQIQNAVGWALSAATTANTNADLLVEVRRW